MEKKEHINITDKKSEDLSTNIVKLTARRAIRYIYDELRHGIWKSALTVNSAFRPASFECRRWKLVTLENIVDTIIRPRYFTDHFYIECHITKKPYPTSREKIEEKKSFDIIVVTLRFTRSSYRIFNLMENFVDPWQDNLYNLIFFLTTTNSLIEYTYIAVLSAKHTWPMAERYWAGSTRESPTRLPPPPPLTHHSSCQVSNPFEVFFIKNSQFCIWK